ncbi:MAG TPA: FtsX-like permease family protein [Candidatus Hydrogenedentes bacterium]|nr:FtsX-like permease family protein [Candidatus Hydrogenedentota bacterium]
MKRLLWPFFALLCVALTVLVAAYVGRPSPLVIQIPDFSGVEDLSISRIQEHIEALTRHDSRMTGYGADAALAYIEEQLRSAGITEMEQQPFETAVPVVETAWLEGRTAEGAVRVPLHPLWPNLARTSQTPPEGLTGPLVDIGRGTEAEMNGLPLHDAIVVIDWDTDTEWLSIQEFGGKAALFRGTDRGTGAQARKKFLTVPANVPRFYVTEADQPALDVLLNAAASTPARVYCKMDWQPVAAHNLFVKLNDGARADATPVIFHAYYDSISVVPTLAPGAEQATGPATLIELARFLKRLPETPRRPVYLLFAGAHGEAMQGMTHFTRLLSDGLDRGFSTELEDSLLARMGRPGVFVGLDLSTQSDRMGIFAMGRFRSQYEHILRPKFSMLAMRLDEFARSFMTNHPDLSIHTKTPFVDCINMTLGRGWWTYFPYQAPFASEIPNVAGLPAVTLSTINDERRYVDTPHDLPERLHLDMFARQIRHEPGERVGLARLALAFVYWSGPFAGAEWDNKMSKVAGRVVWLHQEKDYTPNRPIRGAAVTYKTFRADKHLLGTRGVPMVLTDNNGYFEFDGMIDATMNGQFMNVYFEAYGLATERFAAENSEAMEEYVKVVNRGRSDKGPVAAPPLDGGVIYGADKARPEEFAFQIAMRKQVEHLNLVAFPCRPITLYGLTEPQGFISLTDIQILDASTESPPFQWGTSYSDSWRGDPEENCISIWADPTLRVRLTLGFGMQEKRLILINNSAEDPVGAGYVLSELESIPSWVLQGARNMRHLDAYRLEQFESQGITNPRVLAMHHEASHYLDEAEQALAANDYSRYRLAAERGWALESKAYSELLAMANNMIRGVLFYLILLLPFAYCLERLALNGGTIKRRIAGMAVIFSASFFVLAVIHPAFRFTLTPMLVLIAFVILALAVAVSVLILGKFDGMLMERKHALTGIHEDTVALSNVAVRAIDLGIANIRRRPQRAFLTGTTIVLVTFTLLSFTSIVPEVSISRLRHPLGKPEYVGLMTRDRAWQPMPTPLYESLKRAYSKDAEAGAVVAGRAWYFSDHAGNLSQIDLSPDDISDLPYSEALERTFTAVSLVGFEPCEASVTGADNTLIAGRWFKEDDELSVILPDHVAINLGMDETDIGRMIRVFGEKLELIGIADSAAFDDLRDLDGEPLTPVNFVQQMLMDAQKSEEDKVYTLKEYIHWPSNQVVFVPFRFARRLGGAIRSVAIRMPDGATPDTEAANYARRSNMTILAGDGDNVTLYAALSRSRLTAAGQIIIPVLLGFIMVLGTMLGSVYERKREIFVYNSVGLSPTNVSSLFLAESAVYAILGAATGYLLGQMVSRILLMTGMLAGLSLNYSAGATVFVTLLTMSIVLASTLYPMRQAFLAAVPEQRGTLEGIEEDGVSGGDTISMYLPFVATRGSLFAMQSYMAEWLDSIQGVTVGRLAVDDLRGFLEPAAGDDAYAPALAFRAWLAPFDLGISHNATLRIVYRPERGVYQYHLTAVRQSGDQQNWRRLTPWFILALRKQLLMWRILTPEDHRKYARAAGELFGCDDSEAI